MKIRMKLILIPVAIAVFAVGALFIGEPKPTGWYRAGYSLQTMAEDYTSYILIEDRIRGVPTCWLADVITDKGVFSSCEVEEGHDVIFDGKNRFHIVLGADGKPLSGKITRLGIAWDALPEKFSFRVRNPLPLNVETNFYCEQDPLKVACFEITERQTGSGRD